MAPPSADTHAARLELTRARDGPVARHPAGSRTGGNLRTSIARSFAGDGPWSHTTIAHVRLSLCTLLVFGHHVAAEAFFTMGTVAREAGDSLRWFATARDAAIELVRAGQVVPAL